MICPLRRVRKDSGTQLAATILVGAAREPPAWGRQTHRHRPSTPRRPTMHAYFTLATIPAPAYPGEIERKVKNVKTNLLLTT
jgi:hypothetical protein